MFEQPRTKPPRPRVMSTCQRTSEWVTNHSLVRSSYWFAECVLEHIFSQIQPPGARKLVDDDGSVAHGRAHCARPHFGKRFHRIFYATLLARDGSVNQRLITRAHSDLQPDNRREIRKILQPLSIKLFQLIDHVEAAAFAALLHAHAH